MAHELALENFIRQVDTEILDELKGSDSSPFRTNYAQRILESLEAEIEGFEAYMDVVHDTYDWLSVKRNEARDRLDALDTPITSPVRRLSRELVTEIFTHMQDPDGFSLISLGENQDRAPLILGHICHFWRDVALARPRLWSSVHIEFPQNLDFDDEQKLTALVQLWMERSGMASLRLRLTIFAPAEHPNGVRGSSIRAVFAPLLQQSDRWQDLQIDITAGAFRSLFKENPFASSLRMPQLEKFELMGGRQSSGAHRSTSPFRPPFDFSSAQRLQKVSLYDVGLLAAHASAFPWQHLNELYLVGMDYGVSFEISSAILRQCSVLKRCRLPISHATRTRQATECQPISLERLEWLHITEHNLPGGGGGDIYHQLVCPRLCELTMEYLPKENETFHQYHSLWAQEAITSFLSNSPLLLALQLWNMPLTEECLVKVLGQTPFLTHLKLKCWRSIHWPGNLLLHHLSFPVGDDMMLKHLVYVSIQSQIFSCRFIREFIEARLRAGDTLKFVQICLPESGAVDVNRLRRLAKYQGEGLRVDIVEAKVAQWDACFD